MRLLDVSTLTFTEFFSADDTPKYAIASHRWVAGAEVMLDDVRERKDTHRYGYQKVKGFADYVKTHIPDVRWLWIDTCCIDHKSSQEVSEAIRSMFRWYRDAEVCLAYLPDVPASDDVSGFEKSVWFSRGWTLQELLVPATVVFLAQDWRVIGHKGRGGRGRTGTPMRTGTLLDSRIAVITRIPEDVLRNYEEGGALSIEEKLEWVRGRQTTRGEDLSYCLLGILRVDMDIRYGEGGEAARARLLRKADKRPETLPRPFSTVPFRRDPHFVERAALTDQIRDKLSVPAGRVALVGLGGVGKSRLAIEYAQQRPPRTWVFWIHASNAARFDQSVHDVVDRLQIYGREDSRTDHLQLLERWLQDESKGSWLIVLDNADDAEFILEPPATTEAARPAKRRIDYIPPCGHGTMLITSRSKTEARKLVYETEIVSVSAMSETEAEALLESKLGQPSPYNRQLVRALDCIPLAITQAAAYIQKRAPRCSAQQYCQEVERSRTSRSNLLQPHVPSLDRDREAQNSVMMTWQISFEHIYETRRSAAELLSFMSFCDRLAIPETLLRADVELVNSSVNDSDSEADVAYIDPSATNPDFEDDIAILVNFAFVSNTTEPQTWEMHRLVQDATQVWLRHCERFDEVLGRFICRLSASFPPVKFENWPLCHRLFPHAMSAAEQRPTSASVRIEWALVMYRSARYALEQGDYALADTTGELSMTARLEQLGPEDDLTLSSMLLVAEMHWKRGQLKEAEQLELKVLEARRAKLGPDHRGTLTSMLNLASTYWKQGRWQEAEHLEVKVLEAKRQTLGPKHPDTLVSMNNLASTYNNQGRWQEAEQLGVKVLEVSRQTLGPEHPDTLVSMNNLVSTYNNQGRWQEAEQLGVRVLEAKRQTLGPEHPDTLVSMNNLASTYNNQGRWQEAEQLGVRVLEVSRQTLGPEHPDTLVSMNNLASTYNNQGRWQEAEQLGVRVLEARREKLGPDHPATLTSMSNLASTYSSQGRWVEAERLQMEAVDGHKKILGPEHPNTLVLMSNLAYISAKGTRRLSSLARESPSKSETQRPDNKRIATTQSPSRLDTSLSCGG